MHERSNGAEKPSIHAVFAASAAGRRSYDATRHMAERRVHPLNEVSDERAIVGKDRITHYRCPQTLTHQFSGGKIFTANHGEHICIAASMSRMDT